MVLVLQLCAFSIGLFSHDFADVRAMARQTNQPEIEKRNRVEHQNEDVQQAIHCAVLARG